MDDLFIFFNYKLRTIICLSLVWITFYSCSITKPYMISKGNKIKISEFGILPNSGINVSAELGSLLKILKNGDTLMFDLGKYIIGSEHFSGKADGCAYCSVATIHLEGLSNVVIEGNGATLVFDDGFHIGTFDFETGKAFTGQYTTDSNHRGMGGGDAISIVSCENVSIKNLNINGNNENKILGGKWANWTYETGNFGISIYDSRDIFLENLDIRECALDGVYLSNKTELGFATESQNINLNNITCIQNGRQGMSWVGGVGVTAIGCKFNLTARGKNFYSSPGAGLNIEPNTPNVASIGKFIDCEFIDNFSTGFATSGDAVKNIYFENCTFWGTDYFSAYPYAPQIVFDKCNFYGECAYPYDAVNFEDRTIFKDCKFEDKVHPTRNKVYGTYLLVADRSRNVEIQNCIFTSNQKIAVYFNGKNEWKEQEYPLIQNSEIVIKSNYLPKNSPLSVLGNVQLQNVIINDLSDFSNKSYYIELSNIINKGGNTLKSKNFQTYWKNPTSKLSGVLDNIK